MVDNNACCGISSYMFDWSCGPIYGVKCVKDSWVSKTIEDGKLRVSGKPLTNETYKKCLIAAKIIAIALASLLVFTIPLIACLGGYQFMGKWIRELHYDMKISRVTEMDEINEMDDIEDIDDYISNSQSMQILSQSLLRGALLTSKSTLTEFIEEGCKLTILNYTDHKVTIDDFTLNVNDKFVAHLSHPTEMDCQIIATHLEGYPNQIIFDLKDKVAPALAERFYIDITSNRFPDSYRTEFVKAEMIKLSEKIHQKRVVIQLILGFMDENSIFCQNGIIPDIKLPILVQYNAALDKEFPTRL